MVNSVYKTKELLFLIMLLMGVSNEISSQNLFDAEYYNSLKYKHDLNLPEWGPYTKRYIGVSHIPDVKKGIRFDLSVFPGFYRREVKLPHVFYESGFYPWEASPNLEFFSFRHELEWKDQVFTDISYSKWGNDARLIKIDCVNNTTLPQSLVLHFMASINFPSIKEYDPYTPLEYSTIQLPENTIWVDAHHYKDIKLAHTSPTDNLVYDGKLRCEIRDHGLVNGAGIGDDFGSTVGDAVEYEIDIKNPSKTNVLLLRYKLPEGKSASLQLSGMINETLDLAGTGSYEIKKTGLNQLQQGKNNLKIMAASNTPIALDGFALVEDKDIDDIEIEPVKWDYIPVLEKGPVENSILLKYKNIDTYYGVYWDYPNYQVREWFYNDLGDAFRMKVNNHTQSKYYDGSNGHFSNVFLRPVNLKPNSTLSIFGVVCTGSKEEVMLKLKNLKKEEFEGIYEEARRSVVDFNIVPEGEKYRFSQERMAANVITDIVYPVYTQEQYIRHHAPGRWWDCLYTWDSGFIGIGLSQFSLQRGIENLNAYLNEPEEQSAFIHHGTPLPVQHYLFQELWNQTQSEVFLKNYYPKLKRYYNFLAGHIPSSTTRNLKSGLVRTWDYFYNSGGWDDYPPQKFVHANELEQMVTPVVSTAHCIRIAKILQMAAEFLGEESDVMMYKNDIKEMNQSLQKNSWDNQSGYFGYVVHDGEGTPKHILKYQDSINYNMGLGGASPLIAGICTNEQKEAILKHLKTKGELWSDVGLSAVDQSAP